MTLVLVKLVLVKTGNGERDPPLTPPKRGIICAIIKYVDLTNFYKHGLCCAADGAFIRRCLFNGIPADLTDIIIHGLVFPQII